ncbi:MAG: hypothetical protein ACLP1X_17025 [Polyangiaceae bacterium]
MRRAFVFGPPSRGQWSLAAAGLLGFGVPVLSASCSSETAIPPALGGDEGGTNKYREGSVFQDTTMETPDAETAIPDAPAQQEVSTPDASDGSTCVSLCNGSCTDTNTDPNNCGACGHLCATGQSCAGGACSPCPSPQVVCASNNTCTDTTSDPSNCGACGHNCQGSTCTASLCVPSVIASPGGVIEDIVVDQSGTNVYWTIGGMNGGVFAKPFAGGNATQLSYPYSVEDDPRGLAVDQNYAYWVDFGSDAVGSVPLIGGSTSYLLAPIAPTDSPVNEPLAITVDPANPSTIYWVDSLSGTVNQMQMPFATNTPIPLAKLRSYPWAIAVDSTSVYWIDYGTAAGTGSVNKATIGVANGAVTQLAMGQTEPWSLTVDATYVYWTCRSNPGSVQAVPIGGGNAIQIAQNQGAPYGIVVDPPANAQYPNPPQFVFWTDFDNNTVSRAPIPGTVDGGAPGSGISVIAAGQNTPASMAIDHKNVYWANQGNGTILEVAK